jgi:nucleoside-diphosphate-sugar epimerase
VSLDPDPNKTIPLVISGSLNALKAAYDEPSVKRFIYTSSSASVYNPLDEPGKIVTQDTWNEEAIRQAWKEPPYEAERGIMVYAAGKTQAEKEIWRFHKEHRHERADLVVNTGEQPPRSPSTV